MHIAFKHKNHNIKPKLINVILSGSLVASGLGLSTLTASAQEGTRAIDEIVVTARKRDENLLEIPLSISALTTDDLARANITELLDVQKLAPGLYFESFAAAAGRFDNAPTFRGVTVNTFDPTLQTGAVFVDGVFVAGGRPTIAPSSIERIEVIRGPQAAQFGRSTFSGAVNYVLKDPTEDFSGQISAMAASRNEFRLSGGVEGPITDTLSARISGIYHDKQGHFKSVTDGGRLGSEETLSVNGSIYFKPTDNFRTKLRATYYENNDGPAAASQAGFLDLNCGPFITNGVVGTRRTFCGEVPVNDVTFTTGPLSDGLNATLDDLPTFAGGPLRRYGLERNTIRLSLQNEWDIANTDMTLTTVTGYNEEDLIRLSDSDGGATEEFVSPLDRRFKDFSQEVRLSGKSFGDKLFWSGGISYFDEEFTSILNQFIVIPLGNINFGDSLPDQTNIQNIAGFGSLTYEFSDRLKLSVEGRYQEDTIESIANFGGADELALKETFTNFLPRIIIDYKLSDELLTYFSYSEGNNPGGFNPSVVSLNASELADLVAQQPDAGQTFDEEKLEQYEIGFKGRAFDGHLSGSIAAFYIERSDQVLRQTFLVGEGEDLRTASVFTNIGASEIKGLELEGKVQLTDNLSLGGTLAFTDSKYTNFQSVDYEVIFGTRDASGKRTPQYPELTGSVTVDYTRPITNNLDFFSRIDYFYTGKRLGSEANLAFAPNAKEMNVRLGVDRGDIRLEAFVENLLKEDSPIGFDRSLDLSDTSPGIFNFSTISFSTALRDKRQFGARATYKF